jgi:hypothetical protein
MLRQAPLGRSRLFHSDPPLNRAERRRRLLSLTPAASLLPSLPPSLPHLACPPPLMLAARLSLNPPPLTLAVPLSLNLPPIARCLLRHHGQYHRQSRRHPT